MTTTIVIATSDGEPIRRAVTLTNDQWLVVSQALEAFSSSYRASQSQVIATYVTRGQLPEAQAEAQRMNMLLQQLDHIQMSVV